MDSFSTQGSDNFSIAVTYNNPPNDGVRRYVKASPAYAWENNFISKKEAIHEYLKGNFHQVSEDGGEIIASSIKNSGISYPSKFIVRASPFKGGITCNGSGLDLNNKRILEDAISVVGDLEAMYACGRFGLNRKAELYFDPPRSLGSAEFSLESWKDILLNSGYYLDSLELYGEGSAGKRHVAKFNYYDSRIIPAFDEGYALGSKCAGIKAGIKKSNSEL